MPSEKMYYLWVLFTDSDDYRRTFMSILKQNLLTKDIKVRLTKEIKFRYFDFSRF